MGASARGPEPLVAGLLLRAVRKMKHLLIRSGGQLHSGRAVSAEIFVAPKGAGDVADRCQCSRQNRCVFDRLSCPLGHVREHRMTGVTEKGHRILAPPFERIAVVHGPTVCRLTSHLFDESDDGWIPPGEVFEGIVEIAGSGPRLGRPCFGRGNAHPIHESASGHVVVDEMASRSECGCAGDGEIEIDDGLDWNESPPGGSPGESRRLFSMQLRPDRTVHPIGTDQYISSDRRTVGKGGNDAGGALLDSDTAPAEMDRIGDRLPQHLVQIIPVHMEVGMAEAGLDLFAQRLPGEDRTVLPPPQVAGDWPNAYLVETGRQAEVIEYSTGVRSYLNPSPDLAEFTGCYVHPAAEADTSQGQGEGESSDSCTDDVDPRGGRHGAETMFRAP